MWIAGRVQVLLSHYFQPDNPQEVREAAIEDWVSILSDYSREAIDAACNRYLRDQPRRRPTPGDIRSKINEPVERKAQQRGKGDRTTLSPDKRELLETVVLPTAKGWLKHPELRQHGEQTLDYWNEPYEEARARGAV